MRNEIVNNRKNVLDDSLCVSLIKTAEEKLLFLRKDSINKYLIKNKVGKINQNKIYYSILEKINEKMQYFMHMEINFENFPLNIASFDITQFDSKTLETILFLLNNENIDYKVFGVYSLIKYTIYEENKREDKIDFEIIKSIFKLLELNQHERLIEISYFFLVYITLNENLYVNENHSSNTNTEIMICYIINNSRLFETLKIHLLIDNLIIVENIILFLMNLFSCKLSLNLKQEILSSEIFVYIVNILKQQSNLDENLFERILSFIFVFFNFSENEFTSQKDVIDCIIKKSCGKVFEIISKFFFSEYAFSSINSLKLVFNLTNLFQNDFVFLNILLKSEVIINLLENYENCFLKDEDKCDFYYLMIKIFHLVSLDMNISQVLNERIFIILSSIFIKFYFNFKIKFSILNLILEMMHSLSQNIYRFFDSPLQKLIFEYMLEYYPTEKPKIKFIFLSIINKCLEIKDQIIFTSVYSKELLYYILCINDDKEKILNTNNIETITSILNSLFLFSKEELSNETYVLHNRGIFNKVTFLSDFTELDGFSFLNKLYELI